MTDFEINAEKAKQAIVDHMTHLLETNPTKVFSQETLIETFNEWGGEMYNSVEEYLGNKYYESNKDQAEIAKEAIKFAIKNELTSLDDLYKPVLSDKVIDFNKDFGDYIDKSFTEFLIEKKLDNVSFEIDGTNYIVYKDHTGLDTESFIEELKENGDTFNIKEVSNLDFEEKKPTYTKRMKM